VLEITDGELIFSTVGEDKKNAIYTIKAINNGIIFFTAWLMLCSSEKFGF
jgi:hypothetical protein